MNIIHLLLITTALLLGYASTAQIKYGEIIEEEVVEEKAKSPEEQRRTDMKILEYEISKKITDAWSSNNYELLSEYLSTEIQNESMDLQKLMKEINSSYPEVKLGSKNKNKIFSSTYWNKAEGFRLNIRHFYREHEDTYQVFMIILTVSENDKEIRYDFPSINGEIHKIIQDLDNDRYADENEQQSMSIEGIEKARQAMKDSTITRFAFKTLISNLFEANVKLDAPTSSISDFEFLESEIMFKEIREQFILISYAEKNQFDEIAEYIAELTEIQKNGFNTKYIKSFYRDPNAYNIYDETYNEIIELLGKE